MVFTDSLTPRDPEYYYDGKMRPQKVSVMFFINFE